jgi:hypothetical protein
MKTGNRSSNIRLKCAIYGEPRRWAHSGTLGTNTGNPAIRCQAKVLLHIWRIPWHAILPLLIIPTDTSRHPLFERIVYGHQYAEYGRSRLTLADLTCSSHRFSEAHHHALYVFAPPDILIFWDASECEFFWYEPAVIPIVAPLQAKPFIFFRWRNNFFVFGQRGRPNSLQLSMSINLHLPLLLWPRSFFSARIVSSEFGFFPLSRCEGV